MEHVTQTLLGKESLHRRRQLTPQKGWPGGEEARPKRPNGSHVLGAIVRRQRGGTQGGKRRHHRDRVGQKDSSPKSGGMEEATERVCTNYLCEKRTT